MSFRAGSWQAKRWLALAVVVGIGLGFAAFPAAAEIRSADLRVNGLTCPFCAFGIEKKLRKLDGVREVEVFLDEGRVRVEFSPGNTATLGDLVGAVDAAGFELAALRLVAGGSLIQDADGPTLEVGPRSRFRLLEAKPGDPGPVSSELLERLRATASEGRLIIGGEVLDRTSERPSLSVEQLEPAAASGG